MAQTITIPGRRVSAGEVFYTDWVPRGGDCFLLRVQVLLAVGAGGADTLVVDLETRGEDGTTANPMTASWPSGGLEIAAAGISTAIYLPGKTTGGAQEQVRVRLTCAPESTTAYFVVRIFPLVFFDSAREY